jgi:hypothetical protein
VSIEPLPAPRRGLPTWVLSAVLPLMLSLGFVAGMGLAHVRLLQTDQRPTPKPSSRPVPSKGEVAGTTSSSDPTPPLNSGILSPARLQPAPSNGGNTTQDPSVIPPVATGGGRTTPPPGPSTGDSKPGNVYGDSPAPVAAIKTIQEARLALLNEQASHGSIPQIDYQQMRNASGTVSLVGILSAEQYMTWESILRREPESLTHWLQASADLVLSPAQGDQFALNWALVETRVSVPSWALPSEVTSLADGRFLIVRYLAGTSPGQSQVDIRPLSSLGSQADSTAAWSRYGPQIRFDDTDIYRPSGVTGTGPKTP